VEESKIDRILQAAMAAPSAGNRKPWHFIVVTRQDLRDALADAHPHAKMVAQAPVCIVPCGEPGLTFADRSEYWVQDLSAATENMLLAATALSLGSVWCGVHPVPERVRDVRGILGLPDEIIPLALVAIGYGTEGKSARTQYDASRVHRETWST
jgi:nitroreductase